MNGKKEAHKKAGSMKGWTRLMYVEVNLKKDASSTSPRWYDPDQVQRVKKLKRVSLSAQTIGLP